MKIFRWIYGHCVPPPVLNIRYAVIAVFLMRLSHFCSAACYGNGNTPKTCITSPINAALNRKITASNTCGDTPEGYCYIGPQRKCKICNKNNAFQNHSANFIVDRFNLNVVTWWQSQTWWQSNQLGLSKMFEPLQVNISLALNKKYLISGGIYVIFYTERPKKMIIERSNDFGKTWKIYQYYAKNCRSAYNMQADPPITDESPYRQICSELYSGEFPRSGGVVHFDPRTRYKTVNYFNLDVHGYLEATNIRLKLEYPGTDGREYIKQEATLNQYYYAISDIRVDARCNCHGHAEFCDTVNGTETCDCQHHTMGTDCQFCQPLYRNRPWVAGNATSANPCEKCVCHDHATSCTYNNELMSGICHDCLDNTRGHRCDQCDERFYRNVSVPLSNTNVCIPCDCYEPGIRDDGKCSQLAIGSQILGQCNCKSGILGRRCDQCIPGKWGFSKPPIGRCFDCGCNVFGILHNNKICDQYNGNCSCKSSVTGRQCDRCKNGFYNFPSTLDKHCQQCPCNIGGSLPLCNKMSGICTCKPGITSPICDLVKSGYFFPNFTHIKYEPEMMSSNGSFSTYTLVRNYGRFFTGYGFARLDVGQKVEFEFTVPATAKYFVLLRYSLYQLDWYSATLPQGREKVDWSGSKNLELYLKDSDQPHNWLFSLQVKNTSNNNILKASSFTIKDLQLGDANNWMSSSSVYLQYGNTYTIVLQYQESSNVYGLPWPLLLDSFILMLDYTTAGYYKTMAVDSIRTEVQKCFEHSTSLATTYNLASHCAAHTYTIDTELYNRAIQCNCYQPGTLLFTTCRSYGGQCQCKNGYGGRSCDKCIPGFYGNPSTGCTPCLCSAVGSLSLSCHKDMGLCACKKNAHGRRCNECLLGFYDLNEANPRGCQECFGYGHSISCTSAMGFIKKYIVSDFLVALKYDGWKLMSPLGIDESTLLIKTKIGMEFTDQTNTKRYFSAPIKFLENQLYSYGQLLIIDMSIFPIYNKLATNVEWHVRLIGNKNKRALFKFLEEVTKTGRRYTVRLHQDFMVNHRKMSEFAFKALLAELNSIHIGVAYFKAPVRITIKGVQLSSAHYYQSNTNLSQMVGFIENSVCEKGYNGYSCGSCDIGYTRLIPNGSPLVTCVPCSCNNRSKICDPQSGICKNCRSGTTGSYCEMCMLNVLAPDCDRCKPGFYGLYTQLNGCKPCNCYLPGTDGGNNNLCDTFSGQCNCNRTLNVGGIQCNLCKENAYNISLSENLRCQECPVCYGLIESSILSVRREFFQVKITMSTIISSLSVVNIKPFYQAITSMKTLLGNLTRKAEHGKTESSFLLQLWKNFDVKVDMIFTVLSIDGVKSMHDLSVSANMVFQAHNATIFQIFYIQKTLTSSFFLLNETVQSKIRLHIVALTALKKLGTEMNNYVSMVTTNANNVLKKKYDLVQKIQLSIIAARRAVNLASNTRTRALNLSNHLQPVYLRGSKVEKFARGCVVSIQRWEKNATAALAYVRNLLTKVEASVPGYATNVSQISNMYNTINEKFESLKSFVASLTGKVNAVSVDITKLKTSLHLTQVDSILRRSSLYITNLMILKKKTDQDILLAKKVKTNAVEMLNTVQNFMEVTQKAQNAANNALAKVGAVKKSVESALSTVVSISNQLRLPQSSAATALDLMTTVEKLANVETRKVNVVYNAALRLHNQTLTAKNMVQGNEIKTYINQHLVPLISKCSNFKLQSNAAYNSAKSALIKAEDAYKKSLITKEKIIILTASTSKLKMVDTSELLALTTANNRVKSTFAALNLSDDINRLKRSLEEHKILLTRQRKKKIYLSNRISLYKKLYRSLSEVTC